MRKLTSEQETHGHWSGVCCWNGPQPKEKKKKEEDQKEKRSRRKKVEGEGEEVLGEGCILALALVPSVIARLANIDRSRSGNTRAVAVHVNNKRVNCNIDFYINIPASLEGIRIREASPCQKRSFFLTLFK